MIFSRATIVPAAVVAGLACAGAASAQDISTIVAIPAPTMTFSSHYIAMDAGFYKKAGLKVQQRNLTGVASTNAVIAGSADFTVGTGTTFLRAVASGRKLFAIGALVNRPMVELVMRKDVADAAGIKADTPIDQKLKALKGKTVAVQGIGSIIHAMQRYAARRAGLDPDKDMRVTSMSPPAMPPALKSKQIDAYATSLPFTTVSLMNGNAIMVLSGPRGEISDYIPFDYVVLYTRPEVCQKQREKCVRMAKAAKMSNEFIHAKPDEAFALLQKRFKRVDPKVLAEAWKYVSKAQTKDGKVSKTGLENSQKFAVAAGLLEEKDTVKDVTKTFTNEFMN
ncbi:MAG: ABC transporter substrate-binding protein [Hyphomicrobiales bacterium]|nr:ABC transporter substrate-binding protein [Hyphomicrobiales bacterium]